MPGTSPNRLERLLFLLSVATDAVLHGWLVFSGRFPASHDGNQVSSLQYYFLGAATDGSIPQWMPFLNHGTVGTLPCANSLGLLPSALLPLMRFFEGADFLLLYCLGFFLDDLLLLTGMWLLARRHCQSPTSIFLVSISALASASWGLQPFLNHHFLFALPLILELVERFIDTGKARWAFLAGNLLIVQLLGNAIYFLPVQSLVIACWIACRIALAPRPLEIVRRWRSMSLVLACVGIAVSLLLMRAVWTLGMSGLVIQSQGRNPDATLPLRTFLTYGGQAGMERWLEALYRVSPALDYSLYLGVFALPLVVIGLTAVRRENLHVALTAAFVLLLSGGGWLASAAWFAWPLMSFYRHLGLACALSKPSLAILLGIGFDRLVANRSWPEGRPTALATAALGAVITATTSAWLFAESESRYLSRDVRLTAPTLPKFDWTRTEPEALRTHVLAAAALTCAAAVVLAAHAHPRARRAAAALLLVIATADLAAFRIDLFQRSLPALPSGTRHALALAPPPWRPERVRDFDAGSRNGLHRPDARPEGARYAMESSMLHIDSLSWRGRTDFWMDPIDDLLRAAAALPLDDHTRDLPGHVPHLKMVFPDLLAVERVAGLEGKLAVFSAAHVIRREAIADVLRDPRFTGDRLYLTDTTAENAGPRSPPPADPSGSTRLDVPVRVRSFAANGLALDVENGDEPAWLYYADTWDAGWSSTVNGRAAPVSTGQLAYKAVPLVPGHNEVRFRFAIPWMVPLRLLVALWAGAWIVGTLFLASNVVRGR